MFAESEVFAFNGSIEGGQVLTQSIWQTHCGCWSLHFLFLYAGRFRYGGVWITRAKNAVTCS